MVVVNFRRLIISVFLMLAATVLLITAAISIEGGSGWQLRMDMQNFLFWGIIVVIAQLWIGLSLLIRHRRIIKDLNRISTFTDMTHPQAERSFRELGPLGEEIKKMLIRENELAKLRASRIVSLNNLVRVMCEGYSHPVVVTDVKGVLLGISDKLSTKLQKENPEQVINISDIRPDVKIMEVLGHIEKQRMSWQDPEESGLICTPVFDNNNVIHFCIWEFESNRITGTIKDISKQANGEGPKPGKFRAFVNRLPGQKKQR